jgi:hypothetical protein
MKAAPVRKPTKKPEELSDAALKETCRAIEELDKGKSKTFDSIDDLFEDLD